MVTMRLAAVATALAFALCVSAQSTRYPVLNITVGQPLPTIPLFQGNTIHLDMLPAHIVVRKQDVSCALFVPNIPVSWFVIPQGPGDNTSADPDMPYVEYTGRTYNERIIAGAVRVQQGQSSSVTALQGTDREPLIRLGLRSLNNDQCYHQPLPSFYQWHAGETLFVRVCNNLTDFVETVDGADQNFGQATQPLTVNISSAIEAAIYNHRLDAEPCAHPLHDICVQAVYVQVSNFS